MCLGLTSLGFTMCWHLEWLRECKGMKISVEGEELSAGQYEGFPCDFIGRCKGQEWPDK